MELDHMKNVLNEKSIDPLLIVLANKGYKWIIENEKIEEEATSLEQYILNNTTDDELKEIRTKKKSIKDFLVWKYVCKLDS
jgi:hypothetical protein